MSCISISWHACIIIMPEINRCGFRLLFINYSSTTVYNDNTKLQNNFLFSDNYGEKHEIFSLLHFSLYSCNLVPPEYSTSRD